MINYNNIYGNLDDLGLPRTPRTYFDSLCDEYRHYSPEDKLLDIAYLTTHGYDIRKDIYYSFKNYDHVSEDDVHNGVIALMDYVNEVNERNSCRFLNNKLDTDIDLLLEDLMRRYRYPVRGRFRENHYLAKDINYMTEYELEDMNGWSKVDCKDSLIEFQYAENDIRLYPGDTAIIEAYNDKQSSERTKIVTGIMPEPFYGNVLASKVIMLGDMPVYDDFICRSQSLTNDVRVREAIGHTTDNWRNLGMGEMGLPYIYSAEYYDAYPYPDDIPMLDLYCSPTYRYWIKNLKDLSEETNIDQETIFRKTAIINAFPYYYRTPGAKALDRGMLASHYLLRQVIRYIFINNPDTFFIIPSKRLNQTWRVILGDLYAPLCAFQRLKTSENANTSLSLKSKALGTDIYSIMLEKFKS